jgi:hypothetical protein
MQDACLEISGQVGWGRLIHFSPVPEGFRDINGRGRSWTTDHIRSLGLPKYNTAVDIGVGHGAVATGKNCLDSFHKENRTNRILAQSHSL